MKQQIRVKHLICYVLCMMLIMGCAVNVHADAQTKTYTMTDAGLFVVNGGVITGFSGGTQVTEVVIPSQIGGQTVTGIGANVFYGCGALKTVVMPDTVISFGEKAFGECHSLFSLLTYTAADIKETGIELTRENFSLVELPAGFVSLDPTAFLSCSSVSRFAVAAGNPAFKAVSQDGNTENQGELLLSVDGTVLHRMAPSGINGVYHIPEGILEIGAYALEGNQGGGRKYIVPVSVTKIGDYAFYGCGNLNGVEFTVGSHLTTVGAFAFAKNSNISTDPHPFTLPESVTSIGESCFQDCVNMEIDLSKTSITTVPQYIFNGCQNIHAVTMPATLRTLDAYAFYGCVNLNNIYFLGQTLEKIGTAAFQGCQNLHEISVPEGVTSIENDTFDGCMNLNKIILPDSVTTIGDNAFKDCRNIHQMVIPENVTYISNSSFTGAKQDEIDVSQNEYAQSLVGGLPAKGARFTVKNVIYEVTVSAEKNGKVKVVGTASKKIKKAAVADYVVRGGYRFRVTEISKNAFKKCKKLQAVTIPKSVTSIGTNAFSGCKKLKKMTIKSKKLKKIGKNALKGVSKKMVVKVPKKQKKTYKKLLKKAGYTYKVK